MAQLLSPVCTEALKFQSPLNCFSSRSPSPCPRPILRGWTTITHSSRRRYPIAAAAAAAAGQASPDVLAEDYYEVLGLLPDATPAQIKKAYYNCMKACHPDLSGNDPETTNFCMFINEVYAVLSDPIQRMVYDEIHGHALTATNPFFSDSSPRDHAFVDEFSCIGCKNCANVAPDVFGIEEDYGRARVHSQCGKPELVQQAIDSCLRCVWLNAASEYEERLDQLQLISSLVHDNITFIGRLISLGAENKIEVCPVDCIHWTSAAQLSLLEDEMRRIERINVALMLSGMGSGGVDVFRMASSRWEKRQSKALEQAKIRMMKKKGSDKTESYWSNLWGSPKDIQNKEEEVKERAKRAAAAARRWREYSRRGADKPPAYKLPEAISNQEK